MITISVPDWQRMYSPWNCPMTDRDEKYPWSGSGRKGSSASWTAVGADWIGAAGVDGELTRASADEGAGVCAV
jgi:hypothetical protein